MLPLVLLLLLAVLQVGVMMRDQLLVSGAAREAAREAAVSNEVSRAENAARRAAPGIEMSIEVARGRNRGDPVRVVVRGRPTALPLVGRIVADRTLKASATMRVERVAP